jgi:formylglycine-generating enzyme
VSEFKLDLYEVTVARFRNFVNSGAGTKASPPAAGAGAHPKIANSGWQAAFNANLEDDTNALKAALKCDTGYPWTDAPGANETKPITCVTWYDAFAFCIWDGGRLPTEAEWNYAAAGGNEQREYPWGSGIDANKAVYNCGSGAASCLKPVGSKSPAGDGKWGHVDLAGNNWEYVLDYEYNANGDYRPGACNDCADLQTGTGNRMFRGGGFPNDQDYQTTRTRIGDSPLQRDYDVGIRCAR